MLKTLLGVVAFLFLSVGDVYAGGNELAYVRVQELSTLTNTSIVTGDMVPVFDTSIGKVKQVAADILATTATATESPAQTPRAPRCASRRKNP